jgi:hypothetical protein
MGELIAICGGGGKTTITKKFPYIFLDIDEFVWENHGGLLDHWEILTKEDISSTYKKILIENREKIIAINKIILGHHPINAEWLGIRHLGSIKPIKEIHLDNIKYRQEKHRNLSIDDWNNLIDAYEYTSYADFENYISNLIFSG